MAEAAAILTCVGSSAGILVTITKIIHTLSEVRNQYRYAETTIRLLMTQLSTIKSALLRIRDWADFALTNQSLPESLANDLDVAMEGCEIAMDCLAEEVNSLVGDSGTSFPGTAAARAKVVWDESNMKEHQVRLSHQVQALQLIIQICDWYVFNVCCTYCDVSS